MGELDKRMIQFQSGRFGNLVTLNAIPGHFVTSHSHVNYFIDLTMLKASVDDSEKCAHVLASQYHQLEAIDTVVCLDGTGIIGTFLAKELQRNNSSEDRKPVYVICPECAANGEMFFRDNVEPIVRGKNIVLLMATISTGTSINRGMECIQYYGGNLLNVFTVFSAIDQKNGVPISTIFTSDDIPGYASYYRDECPYCKNNTPIDALVSSYGYSRFVNQ
ncbi:MAG: orotate phosphoribosyltransferase [Eubacterium sp.]|nr:orotate phosphoribosyltransferase [Eubacterium sp.]